MAKKVLLIMVLVVLITLMVISQNQKGEIGLTGVENHPIASQEPEAIELNFIPKPIKILDRINNEVELELLENRILNNIAGVEQILVNFSIVNEHETRLVLQDKHDFYDLDLIIEDPKKVEVLAKDANNDGAQELFVVVDRGTTYKEVKVYTYNGEDWLCILAAENQAP